MKPVDPDADHDAGRPILQLRPADTVSLAELVAEAVASAVDPAARRWLWIRQDVDPRLEVSGVGPLLLEAVAHLVADAVAATACRRAASDFPAVRELVVTAVDTALALEIEIADSAPDTLPETGRQTVAPGVVVTAVARMGGSLTVQPCPEGGRAVTIHLPRRRARGLAA